LTKKNKQKAGIRNDNHDEAMAMDDGQWTMPNSFSKSSCGGAMQRLFSYVLVRTDTLEGGVRFMFFFAEILYALLAMRVLAAMCKVMAW
jgi:hypothetical protein